MLLDPSKEFLPASALEGGRCPEWVRNALIEVLRKFESGEVEAGYSFSMDSWKHAYPGCGTEMCIGGWIEHVGGRLFKDSLIWSLPQLYALCHPRLKGVFWCELTMPQACRAIRHYLITGDGEHAWDDACNG